jgi:hypothetical protein
MNSEDLRVISLTFLSSYTSHPIWRDNNTFSQSSDQTICFQVDDNGVNILNIISVQVSN